MESETAIESESRSGGTHRAQKKRRTRESILANAIALFRKSGIRNTRSTDIAKASEISPATLFNYFPTKNDLAEAWVRGEIRERLEDMARVAGDSGVRSGLRNACLDLADASCVEPNLRLEAWRVAGRAVAEGSAPIEALEHVIGREQERARLRADLSARAIAQMLRDAIEGGLISGLRDDPRPGHLGAVLRARVDLVLDGSRKRNERVSAPSR